MSENTANARNTPPTPICPIRTKNPNCLVCGVCVVCVGLGWFVRFDRGCAEAGRHEVHTYVGG
jgi:hypothetical protein